MGKPRGTQVVTPLHQGVLYVTILVALYFLLYACSLIRFTSLFGQNPNLVLLKSEGPSWLVKTTIKILDRYLYIMVCIYIMVYIYNGIYIIVYIYTIGQSFYEATSPSAGLTDSIPGSWRTSSSRTQGRAAPAGWEKWNHWSVEIFQPNVEIVFQIRGDLSRDGLPKGGFTVNSADSLVLLLYLRHPIFE